MAVSEEITFPLISVIVPCYNQATFLNEALDSVLAQTYANWECIVINDGSADCTEKVAREYSTKDNRITFITKKNHGLPAARNTGIEQASGTYILPLDADDKIGSTYLAKALNVFQDYPKTKLVYGQAEYFGDKKGKWFLPIYHYKNLLAFNSIFCSAVFRKTDWEKIGKYDDLLIKGYEDWDFWIRLLDEKSDVYQLPDVVFFYRIKQASMLTDLLHNHADEISWNIFLKHSHKYKTIFPSPQCLFYEQERLNSVTNFYRYSKEYRLGRFLFSPLRYLKKLFYA